jgi:UDP-N-acetylglucosamine 2-epimerase (non-hydrolysing)
LIRVSESVPVLFVAHPRTIKGLEKFGLKNSLESCADIHLLEPIPYIRFMSLITAAKLVITDSGGLQEETTYLGIPCLTMRDNTERPITVSSGTNRLVNVATLADHLQKVLDGDWPTGECPPLWDGKTAERAVEALRRRTNM